MKAKKSFGQHFLNSEAVANKIADRLTANKDTDMVLAIGPGRGMLTKYLLDKPYQLFAVEADRDMVTYLKFAYPKLTPTLIPDDVLKVRLEQHFDDQFYVIGNFPYNISSQILIKVIKYRDRVPELVGMFQKEVAERVAAKPGSKTYGVISVLVQAFFKCEYLFTVERGSFTPPPKVLSGVIRLTRFRDELDVDYGDFKAVVKIAFNQRRKMLRNTLKPLFPNEAIAHLDLLEKRPEQLSVDDFIALTKIYATYKKPSSSTEEESEEEFSEE